MKDRTNSGDTARKILNSGNSEFIWLLADELRAMFSGKLEIIEESNLSQSVLNEEDLLSIRWFFYAVNIVNQWDNLEKFVEAIKDNE